MTPDVSETDLTPGALTAHNGHIMNQRTGEPITCDECSTQAVFLASDGSDAYALCGGHLVAGLRGAVRPRVEVQQVQADAVEVDEE